MTPSDPSSSSKTHVFPGVTLQTLESMQSKPGGSYKLALDPEGFRGSLTLDVGVGEVVVRFSHDSARNELTLTLVKKPIFVPASMIWTGAEQMLRQAGEQPSAPSARSVDGD